jgi:hypothetical protein
MKDDKTKQDGRDDTKIDANDPNEVAYAAKKIGVSATEIKEAIKAVGSSREKVEKYLKDK